MKLIKPILIIAAVTTVALILVAPVGPLPGIFIGGTPAEPPAQWDTAAAHEIRLRVPGALPRVVVIWVAQQNNALYIVGAVNSGWVMMLGEGGPVEMRLGDMTYPLNASRLKQGWEPAIQAYLDKYRPDYPDIVAGFPSIEEAGDQIAVYRLERT